LIIGGLLILAMVVIGGITRLTHSGLSIVTWQPIKGILPPMNEQEWQQAFDGYKQIPEYQKVHHYFELADFKKIFFWEYLHRMLGRFLGIAFLLPFLYFYVTGKLKNGRLFRRLLLIFIIGGLQGLAGWYMVKSGLVENTSVDHIRLALHMSIALLILSVIFWTVLELLYPKIDIKQSKFYKTLHQTGIFLGIIVIVQIIYGGLTAGLKAGYVFPTYPKMGTKYLPDIAYRTFEREGLLAWFHDPIWVQFIHRWLGFIILIAILYFAFKFIKKIQNKQLRIALIITTLLVSLQYIYGVLVIILKVPIWLAVLHQVNAFLLYLNLVAVVYFSTNRNQKYL
jgi:cytochrome c oxidase assembly protein subunit 15